MKQDKKHNNFYDVIILGGGIVGNTLALLLARSPLRILLLDNQMISLNWRHEQHDLRVSAINRLVETIFRDIDIWQKIRDARVSPYCHMCVWDETITSAIHFSAADINQPNLGYIVENNLLQKVLVEKIKQCENIHMLCPIEAKALERNNQEIKLYTDQKTFRAKLLIGSDGANSWVKKETNIDSAIYDYQQLALVCQVTSTKPHQKTAWQRFLPSGPLAFLPLQDLQHCSIVWSTGIDHANDLYQLKKKLFLQQLSKAFDYQLGEAQDCSARFLFPLTLSHAKNYVQSRIALVGDSAHKIHPLAGQGLNLGLADAYKLHEVILMTNKKQRDIGHIANLRKYERTQRPINQIMATAMTVFNHIFSNTNPLLIPVRNKGLKVCHKIPFIKNYFAQQALGIQEIFYVY